MSECPGVEVPWKPTEDRTRPRLFLGGCVIPDKNCTGKFGWRIVQETRLDGYAGLSAIGKFNFLLELPNATGIGALAIFEGDAVDGEPSPEHADDEIKHRRGGESRSCACDGAIWDARQILGQPQ